MPAGADWSGRRSPVAGRQGRGTGPAQRYQRVTPALRGGVRIGPHPLGTGQEGTAPGHPSPRRVAVRSVIRAEVRPCGGIRPSPENAKAQGHGPGPRPPLGTQGRRRPGRSHSPPRPGAREGKDDSLPSNRQFVVRFGPPYAPPASHVEVDRPKPRIVTRPATGATPPQGGVFRKFRKC